MHVIMYLAFLLIVIMSVYGGYQSGIYEGTFSFFRNFIAFVLAFTLFNPLARFLSGVVPALDDYPALEYLEVIVFAVVLVAFIEIADKLRLKYFFSTVDVTINTYADRIAGGILGLFNGIVITGVLLILWAMLPLVAFLPGDFGRVHTNRLPVDSGAVLLRMYAYGSEIMGGEKFPLEGVEVEDAAADPSGIRSEKGWLWYYKTHADINKYEMKRIRGGE